MGLLTNGDEKISSVIARLIQKYGVRRVTEMINLYRSCGEVEISLYTWLKVSLENSFKPVAASPIISCPLCGSSAGMAVGSYIYYSHFINLKQCRECGLGYVDTQLNSQTVASHFESAYKDEEYFLERRSKCYQQVLEIIQSVSAKGRFLDVGCAKGHFLRMAIKAGFDAIGCDISQEAVNFCNKIGLPVYQGEVGSLDFSNSSFEIITCIDSLYYSQRLKDDLLRMACLLKPGGILVLRIPNRSLRWCRLLSQALVLLKIRPRYRNLLFFNPEHVYVFEKKFFKSALRRFGFQCMSIHAAHPGPGWMKMPLAEILYYLSEIDMGLIRLPMICNSVIVTLRKEIRFDH
jgi:SAM-dependent methyltransferase